MAEPGRPAPLGSTAAQPLAHRSQAWGWPGHHLGDHGRLLQGPLQRQVTVTASWQDLCPHPTRCRSAQELPGALLDPKSNHVTCHVPPNPAVWAATQRSQAGSPLSLQPGTKSHSGQQDLGGIQ